MSQYHSFVIMLGGAGATRPTYYILCEGLCWCSFAVCAWGAK